MAAMTIVLCVSWDCVKPKNSACVVYTKRIIHLSVSESGRYLPSRKASR